jgi:uncharacterized membrane protein YhaH (DUF805 family)
MSAAAAKPKGPGLREIYRELRRPKVAAMAALGFSSGLPFLLTAGTFGYWLRDEHISLKAIGFISWVGLAYTLKFLWAPIIDRLDAPILGKLLGRRRGWMLVSQLVVAAGLIAMAIITPAGGLIPMGAAALVVAFASSTQDIVIDAWRIESAENSEELALLSGAYQMSYRVALLVADSLILLVANHGGWPLSYWVMAGFMGIGIAGVLGAVEPPPTIRAAIDRIRRSEFWQYVLYAAVGALAVMGVIELLRLVRDVMPEVNGKKLDFGFKLESARAADLLVLALMMIPLGLFGVKRLHDRNRKGWWVVLFLGPLAALTAWVVSQGLLKGGLATAHSALRAEIHSGGFGVLSVLVLLAVLGFAWWVIDLGLMRGTEGANRWGDEPSRRPPREVAWRTFEPGVGPLIVFFRAWGPVAALMLVFIALYRLPEFVMGPMATPFYSDLGINKDYVALVRGTFGFFGTIFGVAAGGMAVARLGYFKGLAFGALTQGVAVASFALLAIYGSSPLFFGLVMFLDNFGVGIAGVALVTYMSTLTSPGYTATQYAILSSTYAFVGKILKGFSGLAVESIQASGRTLMEAYAIFFVGAGLIGVPAVLFLVWLMAAKPKRRDEPQPSELSAPSS